MAKLESRIQSLRTRITEEIAQQADQMPTNPMPTDQMPTDEMPFLRPPAAQQMRPPAAQPMRPSQPSAPQMPFLRPPTQPPIVQTLH